MEPRLLAGLPEPQRTQLRRAATTRRFGSNEIVFHDGDPARSLHMLVEGHVAIRSTTPYGDVITMAILRPGDHFGDVALVSSDSRSATAIALDPVTTLSLTLDELRDLSEAHVVIDRLLLAEMAMTIRRLSERLTEALYLPAQVRVFRRLLEASDVFGGPNSPVMDVPISQETLAQLAGTTRPTVNRTLRRAELASAVELKRRHIRIIEPAWLAKQARR